MADKTQIPLELSFPMYSGFMGEFIDNLATENFDYAAKILANLPRGVDNADNVRRLITQVEGYKLLFEKANVAHAKLEALDFDFSSNDVVRYFNITVGLGVDELQRLLTRVRDFDDALGSTRTPQEVGLMLEELAKYKSKVPSSDLEQLAPLLKDYTPAEIRAKLERLEALEEKERVSQSSEISDLLKTI